MRSGLWTSAAMFSCLAFCSSAMAQEATKFTVGEGKLEFKAPASWNKKTPKVRIIEVEYEVPAAKGDELAGRMTVMGAGGTVEANIDRWIGQFDQPGGGDTKDKAKIEKLKVSGQDVQWVDLSGTYKDNPAPFAGGKPVLRENYRMLAAIVQTKESGNYFLKFYGPKATVTENEKAFRDLVDSMQVK
ncbi:hypothetical protein ETAA8_55620 [Anatilimnocola aggregata]|uniref:PsbP C-terminal domain-containing protein n=1 Tax=Anatilimnocola aggregata TaxID=2528021 RepID=A0A517YJN5_9BACT|nr:hypothetical protein [Anatilimnocola aggregata]QDU30422.1 hypothetical protein ETAA8_55620 [Anatilimnocola aggregata]